MRRFGHQQAFLAAGHGDAARCQHDNVVFNELLHQPQVGFVMPDSGIVAADHARDAADAAADNIVVERLIGGAERAAQQIVDGFMREADHHVLLLLGDDRLCFYRVGIGIDGGADNLLWPC